MQTLSTYNYILRNIIHQITTILMRKMIQKEKQNYSFLNKKLPYKRGKQAV